MDGGSEERGIRCVDRDGELRRSWREHEEDGHKTSGDNPPVPRVHDAVLELRKAQASGRQVQETGVLVVPLPGLRLERAADPH
jgi:hypothetical protein